MVGIDPVSEKLGKIEAKMDNMIEGHRQIKDEVRDMRKDLNNHKIKIAYIAGGVSTAVTLVIGYLKSKLF